MTNEQSRTNTEVIKNTYYSKNNLSHSDIWTEKEIELTQSPNGCHGLNYLSVAKSCVIIGEVKYIKHRLYCLLHC